MQAVAIFDPADVWSTVITRSIPRRSILAPTYTVTWKSSCDTLLFWASIRVNRLFHLEQDPPDVMPIQGSCSLNRSSWAIIRSSHRYRDIYRLAEICNQSPPRRIRCNYHLIGSRFANRYSTRRIVQNDSFIVRSCLALGSTTNLAEPTRMSECAKYSKTQIPVAARIYSHFCRSSASAMRKCKPKH